MGGFRGVEERKITRLYYKLKDKKSLKKPNTLAIHLHAQMLNRSERMTDTVG